jgi:ABC-type molybdate transport system ATPase subunit
MPLCSLDRRRRANVTQTLERATPESVGISSNTILELVDELERTGQNAHSLMVVRHGRVAAEAWWAPMGPQVPHELFSLTKSFTPPRRRHLPSTKAW